MTSIYILFCEAGYDGKQVLSVFSTKEKAQEYVDYLESNNHYGNLSISEYPIDYTIKFYDL